MSINFNGDNNNNYNSNDSYNYPYIINDTLKLYTNKEVYNRDANSFKIDISSVVFDNSFVITPTGATGNIIIDDLNTKYKKDNK